MEAGDGALRRLPDGAELSDLFRTYPVGVRELLAYHDQVLRLPAPLTVAERELIAAVVSGVNACSYCYGAHRIIAETFGVDESVIRSAIDDPDMALVPDHLRPMLRFVEKLTRAPSGIRRADREAVYAAGWSEEALYYAVLTCALFNAMNRIVDGMGIATSPEIRARQRERHQRATGEPVNESAYLDYGRKLGLVEPEPDSKSADRAWCDMLSCEQFRLLVGGDPERLSFAQQLHRLACLGCARYLLAMRRMNRTIRRALLLHVFDIRPSEPPEYSTAPPGARRHRLH